MSTKAQLSLKTHTNDYSCNYLDIFIKIIDNRIATTLNNKTDIFDLIRLPHAKTAISIKVNAATISTETLRNLLKNLSSDLPFDLHDDV